MSELKNITKKLNSALHGIKPSEDKKPLEGAFNLITGIDDPPSYYVFYTLMGGYQLPCLAQGDKSVWATKITYKGIQYIIRDWKRSTWSIETNDKSQQTKIYAMELIKKIKSASKIMFREIENDFREYIKKNEMYLPNNDLPPKKWTLRRDGGIIAADIKTREVSNGRSREQETAV